MQVQRIDTQKKIKESEDKREACKDDMLIQWSLSGIS